MTRRDGISRRPPLAEQLSWFIRLRWGAGLAVILAGLADHLWMGWFERPLGMLSVGIAILVCNALLRVVIRPVPFTPRRRSTLVGLTWVQIAADLICLTLLALWTGGSRSPLLGFYVFHMVITSLLLPHGMAYAAAAASGLMLGAGLWATGRWPAGYLDALVLVGWAVTLLMTVYLTGGITRSLHRHRLRVLRQSHRIRSMSQELRRQQKAMVQQDKMAAMGQLAAGVAHEIANPLACMDSLLQLIQRNPDRMRTDAADRLREQIGRISQIVRQLTDFAHPAEAQRERTSIDEIVGRAVQMVRFDRRIREAELHIDRQQTPQTAVVKAQPHALEQVLVNIILNAMDAMAEEDLPRMNIRTWREDDECFIEVSDNGHGIRPEHIDHLFDPFFTTKPVGKGTGLGLAIAYRLVRSHGGRIEAASNGKGARFTICLPAAAPVP